MAYNKGFLKFQSVRYQFYPYGGMPFVWIMNKRSIIMAREKNRTGANHPVPEIPLRRQGIGFLRAKPLQEDIHDQSEETGSACRLINKPCSSCF